MGECLVDEKVWIVKSHFPLCNEDRSFKAPKAICCVRNPKDVVSSMFNFKATHSQNSNVDDECFQILKDDWDVLMKNEISCWKDFHDYWIKKY